MPHVRHLAVAREIGDVELAAVPRHPREIPGEEAESRTVRRDARVRVEVAAARDDPGLGRPVRRHGNELVDDVLGCVALRVPLANPYPEGAVGGHSTVGVAMTSHRHLGRDRHRLLVGVDAAQALVVEPRNVRDAVVDAVRPASVLVHRRTHVEVPRDDVDGTCARFEPNEHRAAGLRSPALEPPNDPVLEPRRGEANTGLRNHLGGDRRRPRSVRGHGLLTHLGVQRRRLWYCAMRPTRDQAWETLTEYTKSEALLRHALAVEASVGLYARLYGEDEELWRATALLHDFDYEIHPTLDKHPQDGAPILRDLGYPEELIESVLSHAEHLELPRDTQLKKACSPATSSPASSTRAGSSARPASTGSSRSPSRRSSSSPRSRPAFIATRSTRAPSCSASSSTSTSRTSSRRCSRSRPSSASAPPPTRPRRSARRRRGRGSTRPPTRRRTPRTCGRRSYAARRRR